MFKAMASSLYGKQRLDERSSESLKFQKATKGKEISALDTGRKKYGAVGNFDIGHAGDESSSL